MTTTTTTTEPTGAPAKTVAKKKPAARKPAPAKVAAPATAAPAKTVKVKQKLVRDSFTMPRADFDLIDQLKQRALATLRPTKKSELLRAGLQVLARLKDDELKAVLDGLATLKPGRPKKAD